MDNQRKHTRTPFQATVKVWFEDRVFAVRTSDVSYGGVFLAFDEGQVPPIGSEVRVQMQGMAEDAPVQRMRVVRLNDDGIGLEFLDVEDEDDADTRQAAAGG